jgi:hypothetical protein
MEIATDLTAVKAMLLDALNDATVIGGCGTNPHYPGNSIGFGRDGEYATALVDGAKLAAAVAAYFARHSNVPLLMERISELARENAELEDQLWEKKSPHRLTGQDAYAIGQRFGRVRSDDADSIARLQAACVELEARYEETRFHVEAEVEAEWTSIYGDTAYIGDDGVTITLADCVEKPSTPPQKGV